VQVGGWRRSVVTDLVRNKEVLPGDLEDRNILYKIKRKKANWSGHIL